MWPRSVGRKPVPGKRDFDNIMDRRKTNDPDAALDRALAAGYMASRLVGVTHRRASLDAGPTVMNELSRARSGIEEALFSLEEARGVDSGARASLEGCREFVSRLGEAAGACGLDSFRRGTLRCGLDEAECALESLRVLVDGYGSSGED